MLTEAGLGLTGREAEAIVRCDARYLTGQQRLQTRRNEDLT